MPKRKHSEDEESDKLWKKLRRIEKKLKKRKKHSRQNSSSSESSASSDNAIPSINEGWLSPAYNKTTIIIVLHCA